MCQKSLYAKDNNVRDLIHEGYTIVYEVKQNSIHILDVFKWQNK